ncbi:MAG TPA: LysR substrate-binding domain-containing protein [Rhodanobacteraceae bacterium]|nr:LysR substrate-binding domain-containing protein [Rhodanobacteraceae bacterium]
MRDLNDLAFFAAVVEHGGFAAAGRALGIPKSRLSRRVAALEDDLGVRLLQRSTRRIAVTAVGQQFLAHCRAMLAEAQAAEETVASRRAEPRGLVRLSCPVDLAQNLVAPCLPDFLAAYPRVRLQMLVSNLRFDLPGEHIDVALRVRPEPDMDPQWVTRPLARLRKLVVAAPAYLEARGRPQRPEDLLGHDTLSLGEQDGLQAWQFHPVAADREAPLAAVRVDVQPRLLCSEFQVLLQSALAGRGIVGLPEAVCGPAICDGRLEVVLPQWQATEVVMHLVYTARRGLLPAVRVLIDFLVERLPQMVAATAAPQARAN